METNINISSAVGYYCLPKRSIDTSKENNEKTETFADAVKKKTAEIAAKNKANKDIKDDIKTEELSMDEYKTYIYFKISQLQQQSPQKLQKKNFVLLNISEAGFEAMKANPQYESWVLSKIKESLYYENNWEKRDGTNYFILSFGENEEEHEEEFWFSGEFNDDPKNKSKQESYWDSRIERQKKFNKLYFEKLDKRRDFEKKLFEKSVAEKIEKRKEENRRFLYRV